MNYIVCLSGAGSSTWFFGRKFTKWARMLEKRFTAHYGSRVEMILLSSDFNGEKQLYALLKRLGKGDKIVILTHSNGFRDGLREIAKAKVTVNYFAGIDMTLAEGNVKVTNYIKYFDEFHAKLNKANFAPDFKNIKNYYQVKGSHVASASSKFVQDKIFDNTIKALKYSVSIDDPVFSSKVVNYQKALRDIGYDVGPIDGIRGRRTILAVQAFQKSKRIVPNSGIFGPRTAKALYGPKASVGDEDLQPWMDEARRLKGVTEISGKRNNSIIMQWATDLAINYSNDDIPWCGLFVAHCIGSQLPSEILPTNVLGARKWNGFGQKCGCVEGAVVVFWREKKSGWKGHVGFVVGQDDLYVYVLAGNQSNQVNVRKLPKRRVLGYRYPSSLTPPTTLARFVTGGKLTTGEA